MVWPFCSYPFSDCWWLKVKVGGGGQVDCGTLRDVFAFWKMNCSGWGCLPCFLLHFFGLVLFYLLFFLRLFFLKHLGPMLSLESRLEIVM